MLRERTVDEPVMLRLFRDKMPKNSGVAAENGVTMIRCNCSKHG